MRHSLLVSVAAAVLLAGLTSPLPAQNTSRIRTAQVVGGGRLAQLLSSSRRPPADPPNQNPPITIDPALPPLRHSGARGFGRRVSVPVSGRIEAWAGGSVTPSRLTSSVGLALLF